MLPDRGVECVVKFDEQVCQCTHTPHRFVVDDRNFRENFSREAAVLALKIDVGVCFHRLQKIRVYANAICGVEERVLPDILALQNSERREKKSGSL